MEIPGLSHLIPGLMVSSFIDLSPPEPMPSVREEKRQAVRRPVPQPNPDACITLLDQGHCLDGMDLQGQTPLMWAVRQGELAMVRRLLEAGCQVNAADWWGRTPLSMAASRNDRKMIALLIEHGADMTE